MRQGSIRGHVNRFLAPNEGHVQPPWRQAGIAVPFVLVVAIWGSTWYVIKDQIGLASPSWTVVARFVVAAAGMIGLALVRRESLRLPPAALATAAFVGLCQFCLNFQFVYRAEQSLTSGIMAIIMALMMIPTALLARVVFGVRIDRRFVGGSLVALAGIGLLLVHEYRAAPAGTQVLAGLAFGLAAVFSAAAASVAQLGRAARSVPPVPLLAWAIGLGGLLDLAVALARDGWPGFDLPARFWGGAVYLALIGTVAPFPLYVGLIRRLGAGRAAYVNVAVPVMAMVISTALEGYRWTALAGWGATLAIAGLLVVMSARRG